MSAGFNIVIFNVAKEVKKISRIGKLKETQLSLKTQET